LPHTGINVTLSNTKTPMPKVKYRFNPESLSFDKVRTSFRVWILKAFSFLTASLVIAFIGYITFNYVFGSWIQAARERESKAKDEQFEMMQKKLTQIEKVLDDIQDRDDNIYRVIFEAEPIAKSIRKAGFGGINRYEEIEKATNSKLVVETDKKLDVIAKRLYIQSKSYDEIIVKALDKEQMLACLPAIQPVANKNLERTSSGFGYRIHPLYKIPQFHSGQDFAAPIGTEIYATADGIVEKVENANWGYGKNIIIDHGYGFKTLYGHMSEFKATLGQKVKRGQLIGYVGNTGMSTGPHVHYEVIKNGTKVNPVAYFFHDLSADQFDEIITRSNNPKQTLD
jgi:murein DD-endopeptidase MepM/ murein hydrolase activator NlpD